MLLPSSLSGNTERRWLIAFGIVCAVSVVTGLATQLYVLAGLPVVALTTFWLVADFRAVWFLLLAIIPFSTEMQLPGGLSTDLPDEPLMIILAGVYLLYALARGPTTDIRFFRHPISVLILLSLVWVLLTTLSSSNLLVSIKWLLAKLWYLLSFYFLAGDVLRSRRQHDWMFWLVFIPLLITVVYVLFRHWQLDFELRAINRAVRPFYRNKVNYACLLALFTPFVWYQIHRARRFSMRWVFLVGGLLILLLGIQYSYTRAAYGAIVAAMATYYVVRWRLTRFVLLGSGLVVIMGILWLSSNNKYLDLAPDYNKTISHTEFDDLLTATLKGQDISSMERVYRWVAGTQMFKARPLTGFGPGNFYNAYRPYTIRSFRTYVSDNEEKSGIHSYFLMLLVEQGLPGLILFLILTCYTLLLGERLYHRITDPKIRVQVLSFLLSIVIIDVLLVINDMLETDKVGPFYFIALAVLVNLDIDSQKKFEQHSLSTNSNN